MRKKLKKLFVVLLMICSFLVVNGHHALAATDPYLTGYKWNKTNITYYINPTPTSSEDALDMPLFKEQVNFVVWLWNLYLRDYGAGIQISEATSESSADIVIRFGNSGAGTAARVVITQSSGSEYRKLNMIIKDYVYKDYSADRQQEILKHEFGHVLGLKDIDESDGIYSIMVNNLASPYHATYPTYEFDRVNLLKMY